MDFSSLIVDKGLIVVPALVVIGYCIKRTEKIDDTFIPFILLAISLIFSPWLLGGYTADNFVQAALIAGGAVLGNQMAKQGAAMKGGETQ